MPKTANPFKCWHARRPQDEPRRVTRCLHPCRVELRLFQPARRLRHRGPAAGAHCPLSSRVLRLDPRPVRFERRALEIVAQVRQLCPLANPDLRRETPQLEPQREPRRPLHGVAVDPLALPPGQSKAVVAKREWLPCPLVAKRLACARGIFAVAGIDTRHKTRGCREAPSGVRTVERDAAGFLKRLLVCNTAMLKS